MSEVILHPYVTEKTMNHLSGTHALDFKDGNKLEFVVRKDADKPLIKRAIEARFGAKVRKINTRILKDGKHAIVSFSEKGKAEEIGQRIGVF